MHKGGARLVIIFFRTLIVYSLLIITMRIMGKRQIGQLDVTDLVTTLLLSELAALPIENPDMPIINALIPIIILLTFEVSSSVILSKTPRLKNLFSSRPGFLIRNGEIDQKELIKNRISPDELISEIRQNGICDISEVDYAIIEPDGKITVIPKSDNRPLTAADLNVKVKSDRLSYVLISGGIINEHGLTIVGKSREWIINELKKQNRSPKDVFLMTLSSDGKTNIIMKEKRCLG